MAPPRTCSSSAATFSLTSLIGTAGPDRFLRALAAGCNPARHGDVKVPFYTFGGLKATSEWGARFRKEG
jgi:methylenetetrahydrofolate reductase (NADPH)